MKILIENYTFDAAARTVTFDDYGSINLDGVLLITNVTDNVIIYNFSAPAKGGSVATNVLTLLHDTSGMSDTDKLQIFYDDLEKPSSASKQDDIVSAITNPDAPLDVLNSTTTPVTSAAPFIGTYKRLKAHTSIAVFALSDQPFTTFITRWSRDGAAGRGGFLETTDLTDGIVEVGGFYIYYDLQTTDVDNYYRVEGTNEGTNQSFVEVDSWVYPDGFPGVFLRANEALGDFTRFMATRALMAAAKTTSGVQTLENLTIDQANRLLTRNKGHTTQSGSQFMEGIRDDVSYVFSRDRGDDAISRLVNLSNAGGSITPDPIHGQAVIETDNSAAAIAYYESSERLNYDAAHTLRAEQTIELSELPTGDTEVLWGAGEDDGSKELMNGICWGIDATGIFYLRKKNSVEETKVYTTEFNRDKLDGGEFSRFFNASGPIAVNALNGTVYGIEYEWLGKAPPAISVMTPYGEQIEAHQEEFTGSNQYTTVPEANMPLFIRVYGDSQAIQVRTGSWRGGTYGNKNPIVGTDENGEIQEVGINGNGASQNSYLKGVDPDLTLKTLITELQGIVRIAPANKSLSGQMSVNSSEPTPIPVPTGFDPYSLSIRNLEAVSTTEGEGEEAVDVPGAEIAYSENEAMTFAANSDRVEAGGRIAEDNDGTERVYVLAQPGGDDESETDQLLGNSTTNNSGVVNPNNMLADDANGADFDVGDSVEVIGFDDADLTYGEISSVKIKARAIKESGIAPLTASHDSTKPSTAGSTATHTSNLSAPTNNNNYFLYALGRQNPNSAINSFSNTMGFSGRTQLGSDINNNVESRLSVWQMDGTPTGAGNIQTIFSEQGEYSVGALIEIEDVDLADPVTDEDQDSGTGSAYSVSANGIDGGIAVLIVSSEIDLAGVPSGYTQRASFGSNSNNDQLMRVFTKELTSTGVETVNGTILTGGNDHTVKLVTLNPAPSANPTLTVPYEIGGIAGATELSMVIGDDVSEVLDEVEITGDRSWVLADFESGSTPKMIPVLSGDIAGATVYALEFEVVTAETTVRISYRWKGRLEA